MAAASTKANKLPIEAVVRGADQIAVANGPSPHIRGKVCSEALRVRPRVGEQRAGNRLSHTNLELLHFGAQIDLGTVHQHRNDGLRRARVVDHLHGSAQ